LFKLSFIIFCSVDEDTEVAVPLADALVIIGAGPEESSNEDDGGGEDVENAEGEEVDVE
jgi:hypothetical protein